jgi:hypothetical protein
MKSTADVAGRSAYAPRAAEQGVVNVYQTRLLAFPTQQLFYALPRGAPKLFSLFSIVR